MRCQSVSHEYSIATNNLEKELAMSPEQISELGHFKKK
jgi:hypothetical protein